MKVLHVQKVAGVGGSERHLANLLPGLQARGIQTRICVLAAPGHERFLELAEQQGMETTLLPVGSDIAPGLSLRIAQEIRRFRPDLVHTHLIHANVYGQVAARLVGTPAVLSMHSTNPPFRRPIVRWPAKLGGRLAKRTIAISERVRAFILELRIARADAVRVVHYGVDAREWHLPDDLRATTRARWHLNPTDVVVGVASRLVLKKGHDFLIDAFSEAHRSQPSLRLLVAGEGPLRDDLERRAAATSCAPDIRFLGHISDVPQFMGACDVLVFPSLAGLGEGFGLAALEGMAAGRPVVATAIDSLPEVIQDEVTGLLVAPGDVPGLAAALIRLAGDETLRETMGARAREVAAARFSLERMVDRTIDVYEEVLGRRIALSST